MTPSLPRQLASCFVPLLASWVATQCVAPPPREVTPAQRQRAQATLRPFKQQLQSELMAALDGGPLLAVDVCKVRAARISQEESSAGVRMGRTSHRLRNPDNAPAPWMQPLLQHYMEHPQDREPQAVAIDAETFGYVEPIVLRPLCTACHGTHLDENVRAILAEHYPLDQATGFEAGDFRGLFWVTLPWNDPAQENHRAPARRLRNR